MTLSALKSIIHHRDQAGQNMLSISPTYMLYYLPLIVTVALVFGATRHENTTLVLNHAWQTAKWITGFMGVIFVVLYIISLLT